MPKHEPLSNAFLTKLLSKNVKVYLSSGVALSGSLKAFDDESLILSGKNGSEADSLIERKQVSTVHADEGTNARPRIR